VGASGATSGGSAPSNSAAFARGSAAPNEQQLDKLQKDDDPGAIRAHGRRRGRGWW
jgi:hypothetical protein